MITKPFRYFQNSTNNFIKNRVMSALFVLSLILNVFVYDVFSELTSSQISYAVFHE